MWTAHSVSASKQTARLRDLDGATVDIELQHLDARLLGTPVTLADTAELRYGPEGLSVADLDLRIGDTRLTATGMLAESVGTGVGLRVAATGDLRDLGALLDNVDALGGDGVPPLSGPFPAGGRRDRQPRASVRDGFAGGGPRCDRGRRGATGVRVDPSGPTTDQTVFVSSGYRA